MDKVRFSLGSDVFQGYHDGGHGMAGAVVYVTADTLRQVADCYMAQLTTDFDREHNAPVEDWATLAFGGDGINPDTDDEDPILAPDRRTPLYQLSVEPTIVQRFDPSLGTWGRWVNEDTVDGFVGGFSDMDADWQPTYHGFTISRQDVADGRSDAPLIDTEAAKAAREGDTAQSDAEVAVAQATVTREADEDSTPDLLDPEGSGYVAESPWDDAEDERIQRITQAIEAADDAFWSVIASHFPEVKSGDFPPDATVAREQHNIDDVETWVEGNTPQPEAEVEGREFVVDVYVPVCTSVRADDEEQAANIALDWAVEQGIVTRFHKMVNEDESAFMPSDSEMKTEVGEA